MNKFTAAVFQYAPAGYCMLRLTCGLSLDSLPKKSKQLISLVSSLKFSVKIDQGDKIEHPIIEKICTFMDLFAGKTLGIFLNML